MMDNPLSQKRTIHKGITPKEDHIAIEEPLQISLTHLGDAHKLYKKPISITMRTPGNDKELALGFLFTEGLIKSTKEIKQVRTTENSVDVVLHENHKVEMLKLERNFYTTSSCGICGKASLEAIAQQIPDYKKEEFSISAELIKSLPEKLRTHQSTFLKTGGLHAAALFTQEGDLTEVKEDVGRHNALDKIIGNRIMADRLPLQNNLLLLSGRTSFELLQKAVMAGISIICAIGAPSTLAIDLAEEHDCTLIGFLSAERFNVYAGAKRVLF
jgi:FdhD protein